jgi:hypothetical protein
VQVNSIEKQLELGAEWSEKYIHQAYPKWKFHWSKPDQCVSNAEEEAKLGAGWADTSAAFAPYRDPARARPQHPDLSGGSPTGRDPVYRPTTEKN